MTAPRRHQSMQATFRHRLATALALFAVPYALLGSGTAAADWQFDPILRAAWDFDDNATLSTRTDEEVELNGYVAEASMDFIYTSPASYFSIQPIFRTRDYGGDNDVWNADDQFLDFLGIWNGDRNQFRIFGNFSREAVRTAELADAGLDTEIDPDDIADDQTGFVNTSQRRNRYRVTPRWTHRFSGTSSLETEVSYLTATYDDVDEGVSLFDFTDINLRTQFRRDFSDRGTVLFGLRARDYNTDRFGGDRQSYELSGGFVRRVSQTTQIRARVGIESIDQEDVGLPTTSIDPQMTGELTLVRDLETIRFMAGYRRRVSASGRGALVSRDELNLRFTRDLNERLTIGLGARAYSTDTISGFANTQDYVQIRGQVIWRLSRSFLMQADYRHIVIDRTQFDGAADSNRFTLWFAWRPNPVGRDDRLRIRL